MPIAIVELDVGIGQTDNRWVRPLSLLGKIVIQLSNVEGDCSCTHFTSAGSSAGLLK